MSKSAFDEISENLSFLDDWEDRYRYLIELGGTLEPVSEVERSAANKVSGCVSQVWLVTETEHNDGQTVLHFRGDSDAMIVKGLVAVLIALFSGKTPKRIADIEAIKILDAMGFREHLTSQRANGLVSMVERMQHVARAAL